MITFFNQFESSLKISIQNNNIKPIDSTVSTQVISGKKVISEEEGSFAYIITQIKEDDKPKSMNSQQQAEYLRNEKPINKVAVSLNDIIKKEVIEMANHFIEIANIDDSFHSVSFYSKKTTLKGIRTLIELIKDPSFSTKTALDILKLINIIGFAAKAKRGKYLNPASYSLKAIYPECTISLSDFLVVTESSGSTSLKVEGTKKQFNTVIPFFDDERIHQFLLKYAPKMLEYYASVGMRGEIVDVPHSWERLILSGVSKMVKLSLTLESELYSKTLQRLKRSYETSCGKQLNQVSQIIAQTTINPPENSLPQKERAMDLLQEVIENDKKESNEKYLELEAKINVLLNEKEKKIQSLTEEFELFKVENKRLIIINERYINVNEEKLKLNEHHMVLSDKYIALSEKYIALSDKYVVISDKLIQATEEKKELKEESEFE